MRASDLASARLLTGVPPDRLSRLAAHGEERVYPPANGLYLTARARFGSCGGMTAAS